MPATAEIVIEGYLQLDPKNHDMEGPVRRVHRLRRRRQEPEADHPRHRHHPPQQSDPARRIEGSLPGSFSENGICSSIMRAATAWNVLDRAGVPGITDVWCPPVQTGINLLIRMKSSYRNQAKQAANAIWGSSAAHVRYKHITVVDDDIDIHDYAAVDWAIAHRVNAGEDDIVIMRSTFGAGPRSLDAQARPQSGAVRHRQMEPGADRRHHEPRLRPRSRTRRRALSAEGLAGAARHRRGAEAVEGIGLDGKYRATHSVTSPCGRGWFEQARPGEALRLERMQTPHPARLALATLPARER